MSDDPDSNSLEIGFSRLGGAWADELPQAEALGRRAATLTTRRAPRAGAASGSMELSLVLADDATLRQLNRAYRDRDAPTNVLAFPNWTPGDKRPPDHAAQLGDVVVAWETLCREASAQDRSLAHHFCHLIVHGTLHLLGYDHQDSAEAGEMEALESAILRELDIPDPYRPEPVAAAADAVRSG